jgi:capsid assembly protease
MKFLPQLAARVVGAPLMVERVRLETILSVIGPRINIEAGVLPPEMAASPDRQGFIVTPNGTAIISIVGTLVKRAGTIDAASGLISYASIENMILEAATDPAVKGILLDVDSPGGEVGGVFDLANMIKEARGTKPIWAVADDAFSAAYLLASAADRIYISQTSGVGSIGVIAVHVDVSEQDAKEGRQFTTVFAGARKNDFSSHEPLSDGARSNLQKEVDRLYGMFTGVVASNRNLTDVAIRTTEACLFFGENAIKAGLADKIGTIREALFDLSVETENPRKKLFHAVSPSPAPTAQHEEPNMETEKPAVKTATTSPGETPPPATTTQGETSPPATAKPPGEVVDLDKIRAEQVTQMRGDAQAVVDLCALAGMPDLAGGYIAQGVDMTTIRNELLSKRAASPEIQSHVMPGDGTRVNPAANLDDNPLVNSCQRMAKQNRGA